MAHRMLRLGEDIPETSFFFKEGVNYISRSSREVLGEGLCLVLGIPGAFWSDYPSSMLGGYQFNQQKFKDFGFSEIFVTAVNDSHVLNAWAKDQGLTSLKFLPDGNGDWAKSIGMLVDFTSEGFGFRSHRYAMIVEGGKLKKLFYEDFSHDPHTCFTETNAESVLGFLEKNQESWMQFRKK